MSGLMDGIFLSILLLEILVILSAEFILWKLFRRKIVGLNFPRKTDESFFRSFTIGRLRTATITHVLFLLTVFLLLMFSLW